MTEREFVKYVAKKANYSVPIVKELERVAKETLMDLLGAGESVEFQNLGKFIVKKRKGHIARNPTTGEECFIKPHFIVKFEASETLKAMVKDEGYNLR